MHASPLALAKNEYQRFRTGDVEYARSRVSEVYCDHRLDLKRGAMDAFHYHMPFDGISFNYMGYGPESEIEPGYLGDFYLLQLPVKGSATIMADGEQIDSHRGKASVLNPSAYTKMTWSDGCEQLMLQISKEKIHTALSTCLGRDFTGSLVFNPFMEERNGQHAAWWRHIVCFINEFNSTHSFYQTPEMIANELNNIVRGLLYSLEHSYSDELSNSDKTVLPKHVRQAADYIREHASQNLRIDQLVTMTGVSERSLFEGFKRCLHVTPMQFLQKTRLANVRLQLLNPDKASLSITEIALNNGFTQLGRFSAMYRSVYDELPSETRARC
ncbi:MAG: AraC family transcriptional regulator [Pseudomonadota bacterium]